MFTFLATSKNRLQKKITTFLIFLDNIYRSNLIIENVKKPIRCLDIFFPLGFDVFPDTFFSISSPMLTRRIQYLLYCGSPKNMCVGFLYKQTSTLHYFRRSCTWSHKLCRRPSLFTFQTVSFVNKLCMLFRTCKKYCT